MEYIKNGIALMYKSNVKIDLKCLSAKWNSLEVWNSYLNEIELNKFK